MRTLSIAESGCRGRSLQGRQRDAVPEVDDEFGIFFFRSIDDMSQATKVHCLPISLEV